jgi:hypothetical protein
MRGKEDQWLVANESFVANIDGIDKAFVQDVTRVRAGDPMLDGLEHLFKPITATYQDVEAATAGPGERRGDQ